MSNNLAVSNPAPMAKILQFGSGRTESGQVLFEIDNKLDQAENELRLENTRTLSSQNYSKLTPQQAVNAFSDRIDSTLVKLKDKLYKDTLTGLLNRRAFDQDRKNEYINCCRNNQPLSVAYFDLDNFKSYNDTEGHPAGDVALQVYSSILKDALGENGKLYRVGGEELIALLPGKNYEQAGEITKGMNKALAEGTWSYEDVGLKRQLTVCAGYSTISREDMQAIKETKLHKGNQRDFFYPLDKVENDADKALYVAKRAENLRKNLVRGSKDLTEIQLLKEYEEQQKIED